MHDQLLEYLLQHRQEPISDEAYRLWHSNPVTKQLFYDCITGVYQDLLEEIVADSSADYGAQALAREAKRLAMTQVFEWSPSEVEETEA